MVEPGAVRRLAAALPGVKDDSTDERLAFSVGGKGFAWSFMERVHSKMPRRPRLDVLAVRCVPEEKDTLLQLDPAKFFDDDHYRGYPAVLVRLAEVDEAELLGLLTTACRCVAAPQLRGKRAKSPSPAPDSTSPHR